MAGLASTATYAGDADPYVKSRDADDDVAAAPTSDVANDASDDDGSDDNDNDDASDGDASDGDAKASATS